MNEHPAQSNLGLRIAVATALILLLGGLVGWFIGTADSVVDPVVGNRPLSAWFNNPKHRELPVDNPKAVKFIRAYGELAVPFLIREYEKADRALTNQSSVALAIMTEDTASQLSPRQRKIKALSALAALAPEYPDAVDAFFAPLIASFNDRYFVLPYLGHLGDRQRSALTNAIVRDPQRYTIRALPSLIHLGTNARPFVPLLLRRMEAERSTNSVQLAEHPFYQESFRALEHLGQLSESDIRNIVPWLEHENPGVVGSAARLLVTQASHHELIAREVRSRLDDGRLQNSSPAFRHLPALGLGIGEIVQALKTRLENSLDRRNLRESIVLLRALSDFGPAAQDALPVIERMLKLLADQPASAANQRTVEKQRRMVENYQRRINPAPTPER